MTGSETDDAAETLEYLRSVIGDRPRLEWFTDSVTGADHVTGPLDVFIRTAAGEVTWGWSVSPIPIDPGERRFRRFRSEDPELMLLVDAVEPEMVFLPHTTDLHTLSDAQRSTYALAVPTGELPDAIAAFDMEKHARSGAGRYSIDPAWATDRISGALGLWTASLLGLDIDVVWVESTPADLAAIDAFAVAADEEPDDGWTGLDAEIADIVGRFESIAWIQADLTWPDAENVEAFRDHIDVQFRSPSEGLLYLASIDPIGAGADPVFVTLADGSSMNLDRSDPTVIGLMPDRMVLALNRQSDGYEPAGVAVRWGAPPTSEEWGELRRFQADHPDSILIHAAGWSEDRVAAALEAWADWWGGATVEFAYDYEDPIPQTAIARNETLADAAVSADTFVRTSTVDRCMYVPDDTAPNEDPLPCGRPATHYYSPPGSSDGVFLVCTEHAPRNGAVSPLLK